MCEPFFLKLTQLKQFLKAQAAYRYPVICRQDLFESGSLIFRVIGKFLNAFLSFRRYADFSVASTYTRSCAVKMNRFAPL